MRGVERGPRLGGQARSPPAAGAAGGLRRRQGVVRGEPEGHPRRLRAVEGDEQRVGGLAGAVVAAGARHPAE
ncbi:hypothetical protein B7486_75210, partial [cyanobacterium TDX16]